MSQIRSFIMKCDKETKQNLDHYESNIINNPVILEDILHFPLFVLQREQIRSNIDDIKIHLINQVKRFGRIFFPLPFVLAQSRTKNLSTKYGNKSRNVLLDGQHRIQALKELFLEEPDLFKKIKKQKDTLRILVVESDCGAKTAYCDIHKQLDLEYRTSPSLPDVKLPHFDFDNFVEQVIELMKQNFNNNNINIFTFPNKNKESIKHNKFLSFYSTNFRKEMIKNSLLKSKININKMTSKQFYESFTLFLEKKSLIRMNIPRRHKWFDNGSSGYRKKLRKYFEKKGIYKNICPIYLHHIKTYSNVIDNYVKEFESYKNKKFISSEFKFSNKID